MTWWIIIGAILTVVFSVLYYKKMAAIEEAQKNATNQLTVDQKIPDLPIGFGYKCKWFAIRTDDKYRVAQILKLKNVTECNWKAGIESAYKGSIFIAPAIEGWTLVCGWGLPNADTKEGIEGVKIVLDGLSKEFGEAQFFCTHRVVEYHCWIKSTNGKTDRVYSFLGESGMNIMVEGQPTEIERNFNLINTFSEEAKEENYNDRSDVLWPDEELVMQVAEHWSINPTTLEDVKGVRPSLGLLGRG